jgi:hypothetical protein
MAECMKQIGVYDINEINVLYQKADKMYQHAMNASPNNVEILIRYSRFLKDIKAIYSSFSRSIITNYIRMTMASR